MRTFAKFRCHLYYIPSNTISRAENYGNIIDAHKQWGQRCALEHLAGSDHSKRLNKPSVPVYFWQTRSYVGLTIAVQISISFNNGLQYILLVAKQIFVQLIDNMMINNRVLEER